MRASRIFVLAVAAICSSGALAAQADLFSSPKVGFEIAKPAEWHYATAAQNLENLKSIKLTDDEYRSLMLKYATEPLVVMTKYPNPHDDLNPTIRVNIKPYNDLKGIPSTQLMNMLLPQFRKMFKGFDLAQAPVDVDVSGTKSAYARMNYTIQALDGRAMPITSELWIVPHGDYYFLIGAGTRQDEKSGSRDEIAAIIATVKITR